MSNTALLERPAPVAAPRLHAVPRTQIDTPAPAVAPEVLLSAFRAANLSSTPYAYMTDPSGESVLPLIEADPFKGKPAPVAVLKDAQWHALKAICD